MLDKDTFIIPTPEEWLFWFNITIKPHTVFVPKFWINKILFEMILSLKEYDGIFDLSVYNGFANYWEIDWKLIIFV